MGRWRPPAPSSTAYITAEGFDELKNELGYLWTKKRPEVVIALSAAAAEGDRSENAEYTYRKKQLGEIDRRVRFLSKRLETLKVVQQKPTDLSRIFFGAWFLLEADDQRIHHYRIVGPDETDARRGWISVDSPMARAVLKKRQGDEFEIVLTDKQLRYTVKEISYAGPIQFEK